METHNNQPFQKQEQGRSEKFEHQEKDHLLSLAAERYKIKKFKYATVMKNCHIHLSDDKHYYSVPYQYIGKKARFERVWQPPFGTKNDELISKSLVSKQDLQMR
ncbi:hypothetical protein QQ020_23825 [Fulvivirgaceae bacterium BMA12]|uniref:Uncharacterized protein n=1 Tax=Agaribacillus aureus TaxID=3051825 RepID=A0ABT8LD40_9BACT|nr:hypothetical protein [Fulvivirgaceae bacterium BMA12]